MISFIITTTVIVLIFLILAFLQLAVIKLLSSDKKIDILINQSDKITITAGQKLLQGLQENDLFISSGCAGKGTCGQCRIRVLNADVPQSPFDKNFFTSREIKDGVRLSCQLKLYDAAEINIKGGIVKGTINCVVTKVVHLSPSVKKIVLSPVDNGLNLSPGQFLQLKIPSYNNSDLLSDNLFLNDVDAWFYNEEECFRSYSVSNSPKEKEGYILTVRLALSDDPELPAGRGSSFLFSLKEGDYIEAVGPFNDFPVTTDNKELCFVGGGVGIAPLRSHIFFLLENNYQEPVNLYFGVRNSRELLYREDFDIMDEKYNQFNFVPVISDHDSEWQKDRGMVNQILENKFLKEHEAPDDVLYYLCGPEKMIEATINTLDKYGVEPDNIFYENF